ncbi:MAG: hypothetical protein RLZZ04_1299 [Cyanobacteriota bacterium]
MYHSLGYAIALATLIVLDDRLGILLLGFTPFYPRYKIGAPHTLRSVIALFSTLSIKKMLGELRKNQDSKAISIEKVFMDKDHQSKKCKNFCLTYDLIDFAICAAFLLTAASSEAFACAALVSACSCDIRSDVAI